MRTMAMMLVITASSGMAQTNAAQPDTLQALLNEVRQLRQDIESMTVASQRVQIALYGLQMQDAAVARAGQRLEAARRERAGAESGRDHLASDVQRMESAVSSGTLNDADGKAVHQKLLELKPELERLNTEVTSRQAAEAEASSEFRTQQLKLEELHDRIERLDRALEKAGGTAK